MARMAAVEEAECVRTQEDPDANGEQDNGTEVPEDSRVALKATRRKFVVNPQEAIDAFDTVNTLRYSQPAHLQGNICQTILSRTYNLTSSYHSKR